MFQEDEDLVLKKKILWLERQNLQTNTNWSHLSQDSITTWSQQDSSQVIYLKTASPALISPHFSAKESLPARKEDDAPFNCGTGFGVQEKRCCGLQKASPWVGLDGLGWIYSKKCLLIQDCILSRLLSQVCFIDIRFIHAEHPRLALGRGEGTAALSRRQLLYQHSHSKCVGSILSNSLVILKLNIAQNDKLLLIVMNPVPVLCYGTNEYFGFFSVELWCL